MNKRNTDWKTSVITALIPFIYSFYMWFVYSTSKKTYINYDCLKKRIEKREGTLGAIWHQSLFLFAYRYRHMGVATMASRSRDGEIISSALKRLGFYIFRGSSSRGGGKGLSEMIQFLKTGGIFAAITVDGPRGPAKKVKPGIIRLAQATGYPIFPLHGWARRKVLIKSWDRTMIPLPFNHLIFICGDPITVPETVDKDGLKSFTDDLESMLQTLSAKAVKALSH
jgi:lysophospholipid acyltransferase (LPLAT)-like uncharacterized protein